MPRNTKVIAEGYILRCGSLIAKKLNIGDPPTWFHAEYHSLSEAIWSENHIRISINTLKRVFGKMSTDEYYVPHSTTLDALAVFLSYQNWEDFKSKTSLPENDTVTRSQTINIDPTANKPAVGFWNKLASYHIYLFALLVLLWVSAAFYYWKKRTDTSYKAVRLICKKPVGQNFHSTAFELVFPSGFKDTTSFTLEFNDRTSEKMGINRYTTSHYYHTPGWYMARLRYHGELVDSTIVLVKSKGWFAFIQKSRPFPERYWLKNFDGSIGGMGKVTCQDVFNAGVDTVQQFFLNYVNIKNTNINGDNFELLVDVKTLDHEKRRECAQFNFYVYGTRALHYTGVINPECIAWADASFSEKIRTGLWVDLSTLGHNLKKGGMLKLRIENKKVNFFLDGKQIYSTSYKEPIGKVLGVGMLFSDVGLIRSFTLKDLKSGEVF